jgi:hypothetical protein
MKFVGEHHAAQPLSAGLPREEARARVFGRASPDVFEHVVSSLERAGRLIARDTLASAEHTVSLSAPEARARDALLAAFKSAGLAPPEVRSAAAAASLDAAVSDRVL